MAAEGQITAGIVKNALLEASEAVDKQFSSMPMTWGQVFTMASNIALQVLQPLLNGINWLANNISIIGPAVLGLGAAFLVFQVAAHWTQIAAAATAIYHGVVNFLSIGFGILTGNTAAASAAVFTFNSALLANPIVWVVMLIMVLIAALYAGVAAYNKFTGAAVSATGIMSDALDIAEEDLSYLRDIAEREAINRFTTAEIHVEQHNENHISSDTDLDGIMDAWANDFAEKLDVSEEGVHE